MNDYNYNFTVESSGDSFRVYSCDDTVARFDFLDDYITRLSIIKRGNSYLPTFSINPGNKRIPASGRDKLSTEDFPLCVPEITEKEGYDEIKLPSGISIKVNRKNFLVDYLQDGTKLFGDRAPLAYNFGGEFGEGIYHYISRAKDEKIYGVGDKGGDLNKAGRRFRIETTDCMGYNAKSTDPLYKHVPFYICENDVGVYGIYYDTTDVSVLDFGDEVNNYYEPYKYFQTEDTGLVMYVFFGKTKLEVLQRFCKTVGKQAFPPRWSFDYCASTMAYTDAENAEEQMYDFLNKIDILGLNCQGFYMSSGYTSIGIDRCVFHWNKDKFPEPARFVERFKKAGVNPIPNIKPAFLQRHPLYNEIAEKGYFIKNADGTPYITQFWDGFGSYLDFTNPDAYKFWSDKVTETLLDYGIETTWNDNNEFDIKSKQAIAHGFGAGEVSARRICSNLSYLMVNASYDAQIKKYPELRPFLSVRSDNIAGRRFAQTWSGDNRTAFEDLRYCHNIGLTMSMSGMFFYGHDLGGFAGDMPSAELLLRWIQHGVFEPRFTIHSWNADGSATMPWSYPEKLEDVKALFKQRKSLIPYLYNAAYNSVQRDIPITAPLNLYFNDKNIPTENDAFMVGESILVGFVFDEGCEKAKVYLPSDCGWYLGDRYLQGGHTVEYLLPAGSTVPYFVKEGSVMPIDNDNKLVFTVYSINEGTFESTFFSDDGKSFKYLDGECINATFTVECNDKTVKVKVINNGKSEFKPTIKLVSTDKRELVVE